MNILHASILVLVVTMAFATYVPATKNSPKLQHDTPCQTEAQWEGRASEWDHIKERNNRFIVSYDGIGKQKRILEEKKSFMPGRRFYEYIMSYNTSTMYTINLNLNTCVKTTLSQAWQNHTIPPNAILEDEYELGERGAGFMVQEWSDRLPARRAESWIGIFTVDGCWPVVEIFTDDDGDTPVSLTTRFFDLQVGIANMSVFVPPASCKTTEDELEAEDEQSYISWFWGLVKRVWE